jgi:predicted amidohydrolase
MKTIRVAAVIAHSPLGKIAENLERTAFHVEEARKKKSAIVCFPEMNISGYATSRDIIAFSDKIPGKISSRISTMAKKSGLVILAGFAEKKEPDRIYASHIVATPDGKINVYRKFHISPPETDVFTPSDKIRLFEACGVKFGIQLCYDAHFPALSTQMAVAGADIIFLPHASPRGTPEEKFESWMRHLPARAFDNGLFIVACNQTGNNENGLEFPGVALTIGPSGKIIDKLISQDEGFIVSDLNKSDLDKVRNHRMRYFLPNRRSSLKDFIIK